MAELVAEMGCFPDAGALAPYREPFEKLLKEVAEIRAETEAIACELAVLRGGEPLAVCYSEKVEELIGRIEKLNSVDRAAFAMEAIWLAGCREDIAERRSRIELIRLYVEHVSSVDWSRLDAENLSKVQALLEQIRSLPAQDRERLAAEENVLLRLQQYLEHKFAFS